MKASGRFYLALVLSLSIALPDSSAAARIQTEKTKLLARDGEVNDWFGQAVSMYGNTAVVGAHYEDDNGEDGGAVYVFVRSGQGWEEQIKLVAADGAQGDEFGRSLSVNGDTLLAGAPLADNGGQDSGAAYIFVRTGDVWHERSTLLASDGVANDRFGFDVSIDGDTAIIGAPGLPGGQGIGAAYIFVRRGDVWTEQAKLLSSAGPVDDRFGQDVSVAGDTAIIGAHSYAGNPDAVSAAYIFVRRGDVWAEQAKLLSSDGATDNHFGCDVSIDGDTALVGALFDSENGLQSGAAYLYVRNGELWKDQVKLLASDGAEYDIFGWAVSINGDTALIGAPFRDDNGGFSGAAYAFKRQGEVWAEQFKLLASDGEMNDMLGFAVSSAGDAIIVSAPRDDDSGYDSGAAYIFDPRIFSDGFESGDTSAWSSSLP